MNIVLQADGLTVEVNEVDAGAVETLAYYSDTKASVCRGALAWGQYVVFDELAAAARTILAGMRPQVQRE